MHKLYERKRHHKKHSSQQTSSKKEKTKIDVVDISDLPEIDYTMDGSVKQLFLNLTKMQIPFNFENTLEEYFPEGMTKDEHGNYFIKIGESKTMFCGHLDTYTREYKKVNHIIKDNIIKTDGRSTLGGDDKAGIVVMIKMIESGVPGLYYFFRGEEGLLSPTGTWGSKQILKSNKDLFKNYDRCVAFDRKGTTSIISEQMYGECCSQDFVKSLSEEFNKNGLEYKNDPTGMWCDSGVFMETIPECTNISVGYKSEHTFNEEQDIEHLTKLAEAVTKIKWEQLPVKRDPTKVTYGVGNYKYNWDWDWDSFYNYNKSKKYKKHDKHEINRDYDSMDDLFYAVVDIMEEFGYDCLNMTSIESFEEAEDIYFMNYDNNDFVAIKIIDYEIYISDQGDQLKVFKNIGGLSDFEKYIMGDNTSDNKLSNNRKNIVYTKEQTEVFTKIIKKDYDIVKIIKNEITVNKSLSNNTWLKIDDLILSTGHHSDYTENGNGINPDDFAYWVIDNWAEIEKMTKNSNTTNIKPEKITNDDINRVKKTSVFLDGMNVSELKKYTIEELLTFGDLIETESLVVRMMLIDFTINKSMNLRSHTKENLISSLESCPENKRKKYYDDFCDFVYKYKDELENYYEGKKI